jgi:protein-S-isoprenylcysteine O-methyltransferase Ste14
MSTDDVIALLSKFVLLATYLVQAFQIFWLKVPSAGSTVEMFSRVRLDPGASRNHPAAQVLQSRTKAAMLAIATAITILVFLLPLIVELFPAVGDMLLPFRWLPQSRFRMAAAILLVIGNLVSTAGACTLKKHVAFHDFGETKNLYIGGIYRYVRNPVSTGLAILYAGFFCYLPSVVMAVGVAVVMVSSRARIRMEEIYLDQTFGDRYRQYRQSTGKYLPRFLS